MRRDYKIIVIDENQERQEQLKIILEFLGEPCYIATAKNWLEVCDDPNALLTIIIGDCGAPAEREALLKQVLQATTDMPLLFVGKLANDPVTKTSGRYCGFLAEPFSQRQVLDVLHNCQIAQENSIFNNSKVSTKPIPLFRSLVGTSPAIAKVRKMIEQVSASDASVLILGESGTGKEVAARNIHAMSNRYDKPFVPINCGAIPGDLLESELFGHEKGAFTGAITTRKGRFELANGGTIFLDEIGDMPLPMQVKLLRVLQERCFEHVGSNKSIEVDVRIIAATHRNLEEEIAKGHFREDLFYRLNVFPIEMPAMRDRIDDLPLLIHELVARIEGEKRGSVRLMPSAIQALCRYSWPGNVRELANLIERLAILYPNGIVEVQNLPAKFQLQEVLAGGTPVENNNVVFQEIASTAYNPYHNSEGINLKEHLVKTELALITQALDESEWVVARAAKYLHMRRTTLVEKMRKYAIQRPA